MPQTIQRRDQVIEAAARLFSERGYHGTSMQHLAEALGILRGSLYSHIDSKEDILFEIVDSGADSFISGLKDVVSMDLPAGAKLRRAMEAHIALVAEQKDASTVFLNDWRFLRHPRLELIQEKRSEYTELLRSIVEEGIESGEFRQDIESKFATLLILSCLNWLYQWYDPKGERSAEQIASLFGEMIITGLKDPRRKSR